jgi:hypothetical protein
MACFIGCRKESNRGKGIGEITDLMLIWFYLLMMIVITILLILCFICVDHDYYSNIIIKATTLIMKIQKSPFTNVNNIAYVY